MLGLVGHITSYWVCVWIHCILHRLGGHDNSYFYLIILLLTRMDYCLQWHINSCSVLTYPFLQSADLLFLAVCGCITSYMGYEDISILWGLC